MGKIITIRQNIHQANIAGLENAKRSMFPNTEMSFSIPYINGNFQHHLTEKERKIVENYYGATFTSEKGKEVYSQLIIKVPTSVYTLDLEKPTDLLLYKMALGTKTIAASAEEARNAMVKSLFYFYDAEEEEKLLAEENNITISAITNLSKLKDKDPERIITLCKYLTARNNLSLDVAYNVMSAKLMKEKAFVILFNQAINRDPKEINVTVAVKEAISRSIIKKNPAGYYVNPISSTEYGKNVDEVVLFLLNPKNSDELGKGLETDNPYSIMNLLKQ